MATRQSCEGELLAGPESRTHGDLWSPHSKSLARCEQDTHGALTGRLMGQANDLGLTCASNMPPPGHEVQAEWSGSLEANRDRSKPVLVCVPWV